MEGEWIHTLGFFPALRAEVIAREKLAAVEQAAGEREVRLKARPPAERRSAPARLRPRRLASDAGWWTGRRLERAALEGRESEACPAACYAIKVPEGSR